MGCFGYICKGCGTPINGNCFSGGEKCVMIHVRHGIEIGRIEGHYDEYGRVIEQEGLPEDERYRGNSEGPNGHSEICISEFYLNDSYLGLMDKRVYNGQEILYYNYCILKRHETESSLWEELESNGVYEKEFAALPIPARERYSGTVAWHSRCYTQASPDKQNNLMPSDNDPNQSWGRIRKKYE